MGSLKKKKKEAENSRKAEEEGEQTADTDTGLQSMTKSLKDVEFHSMRE